MTIYCPSCGKPNTDQAEKCASCGKELEKAKPAGSKFKGTMMMTGMSPPKPPGKSAEGEEEGQAAPAGGEAQGPAAGTPGESQAEPKKNLAFQQTMMGPMTPPGGGAGAGGAAPPPAGPSGAGAPSPAGQGPDKPRIPSPPP
ncbi:MAG: zinc ribbon domain-containing protein, partial [Myxococcota bacterium]